MRGGPPLASERMNRVAYRRAARGSSSRRSTKFAVGARSSWDPDGLQDPHEKSSAGRVVGSSLTAEARRSAEHGGGAEREERRETRSSPLVGLLLSSGLRFLRASAVTSSQISAPWPRAAGGSPSGRDSCRRSRRRS